MKKLILNFLLALVLIPSLALAVGKTYESSTNQTSQTIAGEKNDGSNDIVNFTATPTGAMVVSQSPNSTTVRSLDAFSTVGVGVPVTVAGAQDVYAIVSCSTPGCDKQIRFQGAWQTSALLTQSDFLGSAGTLAAPWDYVSFYDMSDPSTLIVGDTGYNHTGQVVRVFLLNIDGAVQVTPRVVTSSAAGNVTVDITYFSGN